MKVIWPVIVLFSIAVFTCGCTSGTGFSERPGPTNLTSAKDLTNQNSPFAARFTSGTSITVLQPGNPTIRLEPIASGFIAPMMVRAANDSKGRLFVVDQIGVIRIILPNGTILSNPFLDLRDRMVPLSGTYDERGLLALAFHPDYKNNGRLFVWYNAPLQPGAPAGYDDTARLSEFHVSATDPDQVDSTSEKILLTVNKPYMNHNGGALLFGPDDGYLYLSIGDGGGANDNGFGHASGTGNAQSLSTPLGKVLRIDIDHIPPGKTYGIPPDNPYVSTAGALPEIYAYGLRNPAYGTFDAGTHLLFIANAGQNLFESAYIVLKGGNYGWNIREGTHCFDPDNANLPPIACPVIGANGDPIRGPFAELGHDIGNTIIGGALYRGNASPSWQGKYVFGTWTTEVSSTGDGALLIATPPDGLDIGSTAFNASTLAQNPMWTVQKITVAGHSNGRVNAYIRAISEGPDHELYLLTSQASGPGIVTPGTGEVWKIEAAG